MVYSQKLFQSRLPPIRGAEMVQPCPAGVQWLLSAGNPRIWQRPETASHSAVLWATSVVILPHNCSRSLFVSGKAWALAASWDRELPTVTQGCRSHLQSHRTYCRHSLQVSRPPSLALILTLTLILTQTLTLTLTHTTQPIISLQSLLRNSKQWWAFLPLSWLLSVAFPHSGNLTIQYGIGLTSKKQFGYASKLWIRVQLVA